MKKLNNLNSIKELTQEQQTKVFGGNVGLRDGYPEGQIIDNNDDN